MDDRKVKIILLGEYSSGKTSLIVRKNENVFSNSYMSTIGVDFFSFKTFINENPILVHVWDTAGEEKFRFIITSYFNGAQGALLVFDITNRNTFDRLDYWLQQLDRGSNDFKGKIVVVGAKSDLTSRREVSYEEAEEYCNINNLRYLECSSKDNINIDESFKILLEEIVNTPVETAQHKYMSSFKLDEEHTLYKSKSCCIIQ